MKNVLMTTLLFALIAVLSACGSSGSNSNTAPTNPAFKGYTTINGVQQFITANQEAPSVTNGATISLDSATINAASLTGAAKVSFSVTSNTEYVGGFVFVTLDNVGTPDHTQDETANYIKNTPLASSLAGYITNFLASYSYQYPNRNLDSQTLTYVKLPLSYSGSVDLSGDATSITATSYQFMTGLSGAFTTPTTQVFSGKAPDGTATIDMSQPLEIRVHACLYESAATPVTVTINGVDNKSYNCVTKAIPVTANTSL